MVSLLLSTGLWLRSRWPEDLRRCCLAFPDVVDDDDDEEDAEEDEDDDEDEELLDETDMDL